MIQPTQKTLSWTPSNPPKTKARTNQNYHNPRDRAVGSFCFSADGAQEQDEAFSLEGAHFRKWWFRYEPRFLYSSIWKNMHKNYHPQTQHFLKCRFAVWLAANGDLLLAGPNASSASPSSAAQCRGREPALLSDTRYPPHLQNSTGPWKACLSVYLSLSEIRHSSIKVCAQSW